MTPEHAPEIVMDAAGYYWRRYPDFLSTPPVNPDNSPVPEPFVVYRPVDTRSFSELRDKLYELNPGHAPPRAEKVEALRPEQCCPCWSESGCPAVKSHEESAALRARVAELEAENAALREREVCARCRWTRQDHEGFSHDFEGVPTRTVKP